MYPYEIMMAKPRLVPCAMRTIQGVIPKSLNGVYYKLGPAWRAGQMYHNVHPFDANGFLTEISFASGRVLYRGNYLCDGVGNAFRGPAFIPVKNMLNTNVVRMGDTILAMYDGGVPQAIDIVSLVTHPVPPRLIDFSGFLINSHPKVSKYNDESVFAGLRYSVLGTTIAFWENGLKNRCITVPELAYFHDFVVTRDYYVFFHHPLVPRMSSVFTHGIVGSLTQSNMHTSCVCVVPRNSSCEPVIWIQLPESLFVSHIVRSNQESDSCIIVVDAICYDKFMEIKPACIKRVVLKIVEQSASVDTLVDSWYEFPVNLETNGFIACCESRIPSTKWHHPLGRIVRHDNDDSQTTIFEKEGCIVSEPAISDSGHIVFIAYDYNEHMSKLVVMSNKHVEQVECIMAFPDRIVPLGLHGNFLN